MYIKSENWEPVDGLTLEPNALKVVTESNDNYLVVAGPGAGKTELLAQRACFLLQTNSCPFPKKILAISFKRDAAKNLSDRVGKRCEKHLAVRFNSVTFDTFAKGILDRFIQALPERYRPISYEVLLDYREIEGTFKHINVGFASSHNRNDLVRFLTEGQLPLEETPSDEKGIVINEVWERYIKGKNPRLTFPMISRLAELIINTNPHIKRYIQATYSHVFLDEFQDTTYHQYDLLKSCFHESGASLTAVGDDKQRIMGWAGAKKDIFEDYEIEFEGIRTSLLMNYRCAPKIIALQKVLMSELMNVEIDVKYPTKWNENDGNVEFWYYKNEGDEARISAENIREIIDSNNLRLDQVCILVKQQVPKYSAKIIQALRGLGINARNETDFQDLLSEDLVLYILNIIKLATSKGNPEEYQFVYDFIKNVKDIHDDKEGIKQESKLKDFLKDLSINSLTKIGDVEDLKVCVQTIIDYLGVKSINSYYIQYRNLSYVRELKFAIAELLWNEHQRSKDWSKAIEGFMGKDSIPIMTIHKSKGLEYHTVIFLGLEDSAFWSFKTQPDEDTCAFFVAMSRAETNLVFTFSINRHNQQQSNSDIKTFYDVLNKSGIVAVKDFSK